MGRSLEAAEKRIAELEAREIKPAKGEVLVVVSGFTGCGKSAIAGEIEIAMKAIGVPVKWTNGDVEKRMTGADWLTAIEMYKPTVRIVEVNVPRAPAFASKESEMNGQISIVRPGACDDREIRMIIRLAMGKTITALITPENLALALTGKSDLPVELKLRNVEIKVK